MADLRRQCCRLLIVLLLTIVSGIVEGIPGYYGVGNMNPSLYGNNYGVPSNLAFTLANPSPSNNNQEPILIHITNVVSPQVNSNSNAISNANTNPNSGLSSSAFPSIPVSDYGKLPFLSGSQLSVFSGDAKTVKVIYIPVLVPVNSTRDGAILPQETATTTTTAMNDLTTPNSAQPDSISGNNAGSKPQGWSFPQNELKR